MNVRFYPQMQEHHGKAVAPREQGRRGSDMSLLLDEGNPLRMSWVLRFLGQLWCLIRSRHNSRSCVRPTQRLFGSIHRLPDSCPFDGPINPEYISQISHAGFPAFEKQKGSSSCVRCQGLTKSATKGFVSRRRFPENVPKILIFVWGQPRVGAGRWHGPRVVVLPAGGA